MLARTLFQSSETYIAVSRRFILQFLIFVASAEKLNHACISAESKLANLCLSVKNALDELWLVHIKRSEGLFDVEKRDSHNNTFRGGGYCSVRGTKLGGRGLAGGRLQTGRDELLAESLGWFQQADVGVSLLRR